MRFRNASAVDWFLNIIVGLLGLALVVPALLYAFFYVAAIIGTILGVVILVSVLVWAAKRFCR